MPDSAAESQKRHLTKISSTRPRASVLFDCGHRLARHPGEGVNLLFDGQRLGCEFMAFRLPLGAPPPAPCILQTSWPRTAGAWHGFPLRFDRA
jgi:hypothetical protein